MTEYSTINERDSSYWTPLHIACLIGGKQEKESRAQVVMVRLLLSLGADIDSRDMFGRTPLWIAINKGYNERPIVIILTHHCVSLQVWYPHPCVFGAWS